MIAASQGQPRSQTIVATPTPSRASGGGSRSSPNPQPTTGRTTPNPISSQPPAPTGQVTQQSPLLRFLLLTWLGNTIAAMGLLVAVASLILTTYSSVVQIAATKWSARNDAIQACLAAATAGYDSDYCNKTITLGVTKPPIVRRSPSGNSVFPGVKLPFDTPSAPLTIQEAHPVTVTSQLVLTITACALAVIYLRPRMQAFQPTLSMARSTPKRTVIPTMNAVRFADDEIQSQHPQKTASLGADADALICHTDSLRAHAFYRYCPGCECRYQAVEDEIGIRSCDACFTSIFQSDRSNVRKRTSRRKRKALRKAIEGEPLPKVRSMMSLERDTAQTGSQLEAPLAYTPSILQLRDDPKAYICYECPGLQGFATSAQLRRHRRSHWRPELHLQPPGGNTSLVGLDHVEGISSTSCRNSAPSEMCSTMSNERLELDRPDAEQMDGVELRPYLQLQIQQPFSRLPNSSVDSLSPCTEVEEAGVWATISDLRLATARQEAVRMQARSADSVNACCAEMQMAYIPGSEIIPTHTKHTGNSWYPVPCL